MSCVGLFALCLAQEALSRWRTAYTRSFKGVSSSQKGADASQNSDASRSREEQPLVGSTR